jgi:hypothetical protein
MGIWKRLAQTSNDEQHGPWGPVLKAAIARGPCLSEKRPIGVSPPNPIGKREREERGPGSRRGSDPALDPRKICRENFRREKKLPPPRVF